MTNVSDAKQVVLVADNPNSRVVKIAYGLHSAGWEVFLLHKKPLHVQSKTYFDETFAYENEQHALALAKRYQPRAFHVFSLVADATSLAFVQFPPGKIVFDMYDTAEGVFYDSFVQLRSVQRYCLENADGVCARDMRAQWLSESLGYRYKNIILYMDYCWDMPSKVPSLPAKISSDSIHLVVAGYILIEKEGHTEHSYLRVARQLAEQQVHFHMYPHAMQMDRFQTRFSDYIALARETPFFHLHTTVPIDQIIEELSQYHIGVAFDGGITYGELPKDYSMEYYRYASGSRVFDYLDAGLPVLDNKDCFRFRFNTLARYGVVMDATARMLTNANTRLNQFLDIDMAVRIMTARRAYSLRRQIGRLIEFYESL